MFDIVIKNAYEGNLKHINVRIPRNQLVVFTGVSGSGKSTLLMDVLYQECQRQHLEAISFQGINKAHVDEVENAGAAILIGQEEYNQNPRSTLGTMSDIYSELRMIFEKIGKLACPFCHKEMDYATCKETFEKQGSEYCVYVTCPHCQTQMEKLTRTHFSFNTQEGACPTCAGLGEIFEVDMTRIIKDDVALEKGAVRGWQLKYNAFQMEKFCKACDEVGVVVNLKKALWEQDEIVKHYLVNGVNQYEGVKANFIRRYQTSKKVDALHEEVFTYVSCPTCHGQKLKKESCEVYVNHLSLPVLNTFSIEKLSEWVNALMQSLESVQKEAVMQYLHNLQVKLDALMKMGLGYLHLQRLTRTLSWGGKATD